MLDIGFQELLVLMVIALLVFGPDKLPELGRRLGRALREFRRASDEFRTTIETNLNIHDDLPLPASASPATDASSTTVAASDPAIPAAEPAVATAPGESGLAGAAAAPAAEPAPVLLPADPFCARRGGRLLHRSECGWAGRIAETERLAIKTVAEGWELGLQPCPACDPREAAAT
jgi:TatA/E family protein of Tat protein translocase